MAMGTATVMVMVMAIVCDAAKKTENAVEA